MVRKVEEVLPSVSVIVPAFNAEKNIDKLIETLLNLDYPKDLLEIIVIDNNSTDSTLKKIKNYPVNLLEENKIQSSYAARNKGIQYARNEIIAFTDSDCIVAPQWLKEGVRALANHPADLAAGKIDFLFSDKITISELYDSISNLRNEKYVKNTGSATTANLFVKSYVFKKIGLFPEAVKSGGDKQWTYRATNAGFILCYTPSAIVWHPPRRFKELFRKNLRIGTGLVDRWRKQNIPLYQIIISILKLTIPLHISTVKRIVMEAENENLWNKLPSIYFISYVCRLGQLLGVLFSDLFGKFL